MPAPTGLGGTPSKPSPSMLPWLHFVFWAVGGVVLLFNIGQWHEPVHGGGVGGGSGGGGRAARSGGASVGAARRPLLAPPARKKLAVIALCRASDASEMAASMRSFDAAYHGRHAHDYVIFSETEWEEDAQAVLRAATNASVAFPLLSASEWGTPSWIDGDRFRGVLRAKSYYGNTESYRHMCRFFAGPVFNTRALAGYEWAWRMDSHVRYLCDIPGDPIARLEAANASYGYALRMSVLMYTVPTVWDRVRA
jgi:hypothetical protein